MTPLQELELHASILDLMTRRRAETGDENLGSGVVERILEKALRGIEQDLLRNPADVCRRDSD